MIVDQKNLELDFPSVLHAAGVDTQFTPAELDIVDRIFATAQLSAEDILPGEQAVKVFEGSGLDDTALAVIWQLSNVENKGPYLTRSGVASAVRLIGYAQSGKPIVPSLLERPGPLAIIQNLQESNLALFPGSMNESPAVTVSPSAEDIELYTKVFRSCPTENGLVNGEHASKLFLLSGLTPNQLASIWSLADTQVRGSLDQNEFKVAMHLIRLTMERKLDSIPSSLPPELSCLILPSSANEDVPPPLPPKPPKISVEVEPLTPLDSATSPRRSLTTPSRPRRPPPEPPSIPSRRVASSPRESSVVHAPSRTNSRPTHVSHPRPATSYESTNSTTSLVPPIVQRRSSSAGLSRPLSVVPLDSSSNSSVGSSSSANPGGPSLSSGSPLTPGSPFPMRVVGGLPFDAEWKVTETDEAIANHYFSRLDIGKRGWLSKDVVDAVLGRGDLSKEDLKRIWRLIDPFETGSLSNPAFIAMMAVVRMRIAGHAIPDTLPEALNIFDLYQAGSPSTARAISKDPRLSFWVSSAVSPEEQTIEQLRTKVDEMQMKINRLESSSSSPSPVAPSPTVSSTELSTTKEKEKMASSEYDEPSAIYFSRSSRKGKDSNPNLKGKLQRPPPIVKELRQKVDDLQLSLDYHERLADRLIQEKDEMEHQLSKLQSLNKEHVKRGRIQERLRKQLDHAKEEATLWKTRSEQASIQAAATFEVEMGALTRQVQEAEDSLTRILIASGDKELSRRIHAEKLKDPDFRMDFRELENHVARVRFSAEGDAGNLLVDSATQRIQADLTKENHEMKGRIQEMEEMLFVLQTPTEPDGELRQLVEDLTRENERIRSEMDVLRSTRDELDRMRAQHSETVRENENLRSEISELQARRQDTLPPPAYHEIPISAT